MSVPMPIPDNEIERLIALRNCHILDTPPSPAFDDLTYLAAEICGSVAASVTLIDDKRQWFKSMFGYPITETPREIAFCAHTVMGTGQLVVNDLMEDKRFFDNPFVVNEPFVRFYAGTPVTTPDGYAIGSLCIYDREPRDITLEQSIALGVIARQVGSQIELGKRIIDQERLVRRLEELNSALGSLAKMDALTGLSNRRAFDEGLHDEWMRASRYNDPLTLIMFDVDHFKRFNDTYGHLCGDEVLRRIGAVVLQVARGTDIVARYGGEEFAVILPQTDACSGVVVAERLRAAIEQADWNRHLVTASFGVASMSPMMASSQELVAIADRALYSSKSSGRNCVTRNGNVPLSLVIG